MGIAKLLLSFGSYSQKLDFYRIVKENFKKGEIRFFDDTEWDKIDNQNFNSPTDEMKEFVNDRSLRGNIKK